MLSFESLTAKRSEPFIKYITGIMRYLDQEIDEPSIDRCIIPVFCNSYKGMVLSAGAKKIKKEINTVQKHIREKYMYIDGEDSDVNVSIENQSSDTSQ